jgi:hypothetical protein
LRALESHIRDKDHELVIIYHRLSEHDQELLQHCNLLHEQRRPPSLRLGSLRTSRQLRLRRLRTYRRNYMSVRRSCKSRRLKICEEELQECEEELQEQEIKLAN